MHSHMGLFRCLYLLLILRNHIIITEASIQPNKHHSDLDRHTHGGYHTGVHIRDVKGYKSSKAAKGKRQYKSSKSPKSKSLKSHKSPKKDLTCSTSISLNDNECLSRTEIKRGIFGGLQFAKTVRFASRAEQDTALAFETNNILWHTWEVADDQLAKLQNELPTGLTLAKLSISKGELPKYYIVLNLYNIEIGGSSTIRAEWSTFVQNGEDSMPHLLILDASANAAEMEPTQCLPKDPVPLSYDIDDSNIGTILESRGGSFAGNFSIPSFDHDTNTFEVDIMFQTANEKKYWLSSVYDKVMSSGLMTATPIIQVPSNSLDFQINDDTYWGSLFKSEVPNHTLYQGGSIDLVLKPWYNLEDLKNTSSELYTCLDNFKFNSESGFAGRAFSHATRVTEGTEEALLNYNWRGSNRRSITYINFEIIEGVSVRKIEHMLPQDFQLVKTKMRNDPTIEERYTMTVRIKEGGIEGSLYQGLETSIIVYVQSKVTNETHQMLLESKSSVDSFQADKLFVPPASSFLYSQNNNAVEASIEDQHFSFAASILLQDDDEMESLNMSWLASHSRQYAINGIYDSFFCGNSLLNTKAVFIDPQNVSISSMESEWFVFIHKTPFEIVLVQDDIECIVRPWYNLHEGSSTERKI